MMSTNERNVRRKIEPKRRSTKNKRQTQRCWGRLGRACVPKGKKLHRGGLRGGRDIKGSGGKSSLKKAECELILGGLNKEGSAWEGGLLCMFQQFSS